MKILRIEIEENLQINYYVIKHLILLKIQNMMDNSRGLASMIYTFFDKKTSGSGIKNIPNKE